MTETKHTPGPWEAIEHKSVTGNDYLQILAGSWDIAHSKYSARNWEEERANARRIVAAVNATSEFTTEALEAGAVADLLTALKTETMRYNQVTELYACTTCANQSDDMNDIPHSRGCTVGQAIAKATGGTP